MLAREQRRLERDGRVMRSRWIDRPTLGESKGAGVARKECGERAAAAMRGGERVLKNYYEKSLVKRRAAWRLDRITMHEGGARGRQWGESIEGQAP